MGILRRLAERFDPLETRADPSWEGLRGAATPWPGPFPTVFDKTRHTAVTPAVAESVATVAACVNAIAGAIASLSAYVYERSAAGREERPDHPIALLIRQGANASQTWPEFLEWLVAQTLLFGNGLAEIVADRSGRVIELRPHPWPNLTVRMLSNGRLVYDVSDINAPVGGTGQVRRLLDTEVLHLKDRSDDGLIGRSRLARCATPVRVSLTESAFQEHLYANRAAPSGVVTFEGALTPESRTRIKTGIADGWQGVKNTGGVLILDQKATYQGLGITPESLEMLEARRLSVEEIARLYAVPPPIIGDYRNNTFTNAAQAALWFGQHCLSPWIRKIEEAFRRSVFSAEDRATHELHLDLSTFLRGDPATRWAAHKIAIDADILTRNEIREIEGWNPRPELDAPPPRDPAGAIG